MCTTIHCIDWCFISPVVHVYEYIFEVHYKSQIWSLQKYNISANNYLIMFVAGDAVKAGFPVRGQGSSDVQHQRECSSQPSAAGLSEPSGPTQTGKDQDNSLLKEEVSCHSHSLSLPPSLSLSFPLSPPSLPPSPLSPFPRLMVNG